MKKTLFVIIFSLLALAGYSQNDLKIEEVEERGVQSYFQLDQPSRTTTLENGLKVEIIPIDASLLDEVFYQNSEYSGQYQYNHFTKDRINHFLQKKKRRKHYLKSEDEFLYEGLYHLLDNDEIDERVYEMFEFEISLGEDENEEYTIYTSNRKQIFNPYFLDDGYFNVFQVKIMNENPTPVENNLRFHVFNGGEDFNALSSSEISSFYALDRSRSLLRLENLKRANLSEIEEFPGYSEVSKYIAVQPLNLNDGNLKVTISDSKSTSKLDWQAEVKKSRIQKTYKYYEIRLKPSSGAFRSYYVLGEGSDDIYIVNNMLYVKEADIDKPIELYYYGMKKRKLYFGKVENLLPSKYLDFSKRKRDKIKFKTDDIDEIKRKVEVK